MNLQALAAMDDCEHATGKSLDEHIRGKTPAEIIGSDGVRLLRSAGYMIVQVVSRGNKHFEAR